MNFSPLHDRVLVKRLASEEKTAGGIIIPDTAQEKPQEGLIVAVGSGAKSEDGKVTPLDVKIGDKVLIEEIESHGCTFLHPENTVVAQVRMSRNASDDETEEEEGTEEGTEESTEATAAE